MLKEGNISPGAILEFWAVESCLTVLLRTKLWALSREQGLLSTEPSLQPLDEWFSAFLTLWPFNTVPHVVVTPTITLFSELLPN